MQLRFGIKFAQYPSRGWLNMAATTPQNRSRTTTVPESSVRSEEEIRTRAYELYEERGREDGYAMDDWLRAEAEINRNQRRIRAA